jgi:uncharacterized protein (TIGR03435 family)
MSTILVILSAVVNSLWQALVVAVLVWLALRFMPRINAATRYAIWWAALGVVLILPVAPRLISMMRPHPKPIAVTAVKTPKTAAPAVTVEPVIVTVAPGRTAIWPIVVLIVWAALLVWRLFQIVRSYFYLRGVKRRAAVSPIPLPAIPRRADLLISPDIVSPMAVGFLRPAVVLPESLLDELSEPEREHVLLHESAHLAKYDDWSNLAMRLLAGALALHPVAIWILWRIEREREMACDDWVVARTGAARPYAASLAHLFELRRARRGEILASGIFGSSSRLGDRIEMLLRRGRTFSPRASAAGVVASMVSMGGLMLAGSLAPRWIAFAQQEPRSVFEVASIKLAPPDSGDFRLFWIPGGRFITTSATLKDLVGFAYDVRGHQISGGPNWLESNKYNIEAKADSTTRIPEGFAASDSFRMMVRSLLNDRFGLSAHRQSHEEQIYELRVEKGGPKLREAAKAIPSGLFPGRGRVDGKAAQMSLLARYLSNPVGRVVVDKTGLSGGYDFTLTWMPEPAAGPDAPTPADPDLPSIFSALQEQLGLRLQSAKGPVEALVIDHAEKPDAN